MVFRCTASKWGNRLTLPPTIPWFGAQKDDFDGKGFVHFHVRWWEGKPIQRWIEIVRS